MRYTPALFLVVMLAVLLTLALARGDEPLSASSATASLATESSEQVTRGGELYRTNCAVCHGATALGFDEARAAFPEEHRRCTRCHKTNNPRTWNLNTVHNNMFSLGAPPALRGEGTLHAFADASALFYYMRATMPRYAPGRLSDAQYWDVAAYLLSLRDASPQNVITQENAATFLLPKH